MHTPSAKVKCAHVLLPALMTHVLGHNDTSTHGSDIKENYDAAKAVQANIHVCRHACDIMTSNGNAS